MPIVIIRLMLSVWLGPKVITLSGFHCTYIFYCNGSQPGVWAPLGLHKLLEVVRKISNFTASFLFGGTRMPRGWETLCYRVLFFKFICSFINVHLNIIIERTFWSEFCKKSDCTPPRIIWNNTDLSLLSQKLLLIQKNDNHFGDSKPR